MLRAVTLFERSLSRARRRRSGSSTLVAQSESDKLSDSQLTSSDCSKSVSFYRHNPLPDARAIRLLDILPGGPDDPISCDIAQYTFAEDHETRPYTAISYHWGSPDKTQRIRINKQELLITKNAEEVLRRLRDLKSTKTVWIDAICINQLDDAEKSHQIRLMGLIYAGSVETAVWIGPASEDSDGAIDFIREHEDFFLAASKNEYSDLQQLLDSYGLEPQARVWIDILELTMRSWFSRLWVVQELCLSPHVSLCCGDQSIDWDTFEAAVNCTVKEPVEAPSRIRWFESLPYSYQIQHMATARQAIRRSEKLTMRVALEICSLFSAQEPQDYIFGLLGLINQEQQRISHIGYSDRVEHLYQAVTELAIEASNDLTLLHQAAINAVPSKLQLPSWVPDYSNLKNLKELPLGAIGRDLPDVCAGGTDEHDAAPRVTFSDGVMTVPGVIVGTIVAMSAPYYDERLPEDRDMHVLRWHEWAHNAIDMACALNESFGEDDNLDALAWTLSNGRLKPLERCRDHFAAWRTIHLSDQHKHHLEGADVDRMLRVGANWTLDKKLCAKSIEFAKHVEFYCYGRRLCITENGMLGIVPRFATIGDKICVLLRSSLPFVLRPVDHSVPEPRRYQSIGTCFANGVMHGEAFEDREIEYIEII